jgi:hypothetical protein
VIGLRHVQVSLLRRDSKLQGLHHLSVFDPPDMLAGLLPEPVYDAWALGQRTNAALPPSDRS